MNPTLIYLLKVNIAIALFYMFYRLFFVGDTLWKARRVYLLFSVIISFAYPLFSIESWLQGNDKVQELVMTYAQLPEFTVNAEKVSSSFPLGLLLGAIYLSVVLILLVRMCVQLIAIFNIRKSGFFAMLQSTKVLTVNKEIAPFSFFGTIYINPALHNEEETKQIITHELTHVRQWHSVDVIVSELLCITFWINPATWLLKREIRQNLEFLADDKVINSGFDSKSYQYHLLQLSYQTPDYNLSNKFNILPLKKRIIMMNQKKSSKSTALKYLLIAPLTFSLVVVSNAESLAAKAKSLLNNENVTVVDQTPKTKTQTEPKKIAEVNVVGYAPVQESVIKETAVDEKVISAKDEDGEVFMVVDQMPKFPGGDQALFKFLSENIKYPVKAQEKGIQGRVICQFVVNADGSVQDVTVVRAVDADLDAESVRVIQAMPKWTAGMQKGQAVRVKYTLPVNFRLNGGNEKSPWGEKPIVILDGAFMSPNFNADIIKPESIEKMEVLKPDTEEMKKELLEKYGKWAGNGVIVISTKK